MGYTKKEIIDQVFEIESKKNTSLMKRCNY